MFSQQSRTCGELKHIEWEAWGWAGQNTIAYVVFDPTDSLSSAATTRRSGKFAGIPCEVSKVSRLESQWYAVIFYTNEEMEPLQLERYMSVATVGVSHSDEYYCYAPTSDDEIDIQVLREQECATRLR